MILGISLCISAIAAAKSGSALPVRQFTTLRRDRTTGLISYGAVREVSQPETGDAQQFRLLESLAVIEPKGEFPLEDVLTIESPHIPQGATVLLITSSGSEKMITAVRRLMHAGRQPVLIMVDPKSFGSSDDITMAAESARKMGIPVRLIRFGDELGDALSASHRAGRVTRAA